MNDLLRFILYNYVVYWYIVKNNVQEKKYATLVRFLAQHNQNHIIYYLIIKIGRKVP